MKYFFAPVQGHTDAAYRHFHVSRYDKDKVIYTTPFIRWEKDGLRTKDIKDLTSELNANTHLTPQIIFRDKEELCNLISSLKQLKVKEINLNMGCPFPLQTGHGRGASTVANKELCDIIPEVIKENADIRFSVKMRLGMNRPDEWEHLLQQLNTVELDYLAVHPRFAKQQYGGEINFDEFENILKKSSNPVVYNGDIKTIEDYNKLITHFPEISGVMVGRGVLGRPSLLTEIKDNKEWTKERRISEMLAFHRELLNHYENTLSGEAQIISKIKPFWEYAEEEIGRKPWKLIKKATSLPKYKTAIAQI